MIELIAAGGLLALVYYATRSHAQSDDDAKRAAILAQTGRVLGDALATSKAEPPRQEQEPGTIPHDATFSSRARKIPSLARKVTTLATGEKDTVKGAYNVEHDPYNPSQFMDDHTIRKAGAHIRGTVTPKTPEAPVTTHPLA